MAKYKVDESNNKLLVDPLDNSMIIPEGIYTENELRKEIEKQFTEFKKRSFVLIWRDGKAPRMVSQDLGLN